MANDSLVYCDLCCRYYKRSDNHRHPAAANLPNPGPREK